MCVIYMVDRMYRNTVVGRQLAVAGVHQRLGLYISPQNVPAEYMRMPIVELSRSALVNALVMA